MFFECWDEAILRAIYGLPIPVVFSQVITHLATMGALWVAAAVGLLAFGRGDARRWGGVLLMAILVEWALVDGLLKPLFERPRPFVILDLLARDGWTSQASFSFPSGHTGVSFVSAIVLAKAFPRHCVLFFLLATCIGLSRIHLGVHYPSDVIAGAFVGLAAGWMILRYLPGIPGSESPAESIVEPNGGGR